MKRKNEFIERWTEAQLVWVNSEIDRAAKARNLSSMPTSPFGDSCAGAADFRGFKVRSLIQYMRLESIDLSFSMFDIEAGLIQSEFLNCIFDEIDLKGKFLTRKFTNCSFRKSSLQDVRPGTTFSDCDFSNSKMNRAVARGVKFVRCNFNSANLRGVSFLSCHFEDCDFSGVQFGEASLASSTFIGAPKIEFFHGANLNGIKIIPAASMED